MRTRELTVSAAMAGRTVESILRQEFEMAASRIRRLKRSERGILLNGVRVSITACVAGGDVLRVETGDDPPRPTAAPAPFPLDIVYEDEDIIVLNKPAGIAVQPTREAAEVTLEHALAAYLPQGEVAHPASRLDRGTTGLMTVAKSGYVHQLLRRRMHTEAFRREYRGVAVGTPDPPAGRIALSIGFYEGSSYQRAVRVDGAPSLTEYETLAVHDGFSLLRLVPRTGRTHQLRLHMAEIGHPLAGDFLYGTEDRERIARPALHSCELWLVHPLTGEPLHFVCPIPEDMRKLMGMD